MNTANEDHLDKSQCKGAYLQRSQQRSPFFSYILQNHATSIVSSYSQFVSGFNDSHTGTSFTLSIDFLSDMYFELVTSALFTLVLLTYLKIWFDTQNGKRQHQRKSLPGPIKLPILGSLPSIVYNVGNVFSKSSFELLADMKALWGPHISIRLGNINAVLIDDMKTAKKLMSSEDWANRLDDNPIWYQRSFDSHYGLLISNGESWKEMRKFIHRTLTRNGFGRTRALEMIHEIEILNFFDHLDKLRATSNDVISMQGLFNVSTFNIIWRMIAGSKFSYNNEELIRTMKTMEDFAHGVHPREMGFLVFPWLRHFPLFSAFQRIVDDHKKMQTFFLSIIDEKRRAGDYKEKQETFIDVFLREIDEHKAAKTIPNYYTDEQFAMVLVDLFVTGFVPTASCLEFLIMFMILNPEIQRKCHDEIDTVIGRNRFPSINDNDKMPYTQAICLEILRHVTFIPLTTRAATKDTLIDDYYIPKGTIAGLNLYGIHHDKDVWDKPEEFNPDRFLDENGLLCNQDLMLPFGTGKRVCPAEVFARVSTFTYFTYLLQKYSFEAVPNTPLPDPTPNVGMGNYAKPYRCIIKDRQLVSSDLIAGQRDYYESDNDCGTLI